MHSEVTSLGSEISNPSNDSLQLKRRKLNQDFLFKKSSSKTPLGDITNFSELSFVKKADQSFTKADSKPEKGELSFSENLEKWFDIEAQRGLKRDQQGEEFGSDKENKYIKGKKKSKVSDFKAFFKINKCTFLLKLG